MTEIASSGAAPPASAAVSGWHHTSFTVTDMDRALALYRDALGLTVVVDQHVGQEFASRVTGVAGAELRIVFLSLGRGDHRDHLLELIEYRNGVKPPECRATHPGAAHVCFLVEDLEAAYRRLRERGISFISEPVRIAHGPNAGGRTVYLRDPDGGTVELLERPSPS